MGRLQQTNRKFEPRRRDLVARERAARVGLRAELAAGDSANQSRVKDLLEQVSRLQRERLDLLDSEQREMAEYMTPVQRAKFLGLQEQLQQRLEKERQDAAANARLPDK
jgi:protein CpxP